MQKRNVITDRLRRFGVVFIFIAAMLLVVASITAPVVNSLSLFNIVSKGQDTERTLRLGTFRWCAFE